jgi:hypothetical protein
MKNIEFPISMLNNHIWKPNDHISLTWILRPFGDDFPYLFTQIYGPPYIQSRGSASTAPASHFAPSRFGLMLRRNFAKPDRFSAVNYEISHRNLWYFMGNPWDFMIFMGIYDILWGIHGILWYFMGNPWDFMIFYGESIGIYDILWIVWWYFMAFPMKMNHGWQKSLGYKHWKLWFFFSMNEWMNEWWWWC